MHVIGYAYTIKDLVIEKEVQEMRLARDTTQHEQTRKMIMGWRGFWVVCGLAGMKCKPFFTLLVRVKILRSGIRWKPKTREEVETNEHVYLNKTFWAECSIVWKL